MKTITKILGVIPARYASTRFPGKPLADVEGKSMVQRVWEQAKKAKRLNEVVVATDNPAIYEHVRSFGGLVMMTSENHTTGTERCAEVATNPAFGAFDALINIQGDEPLIDPNQIDLLASLFDNSQTNIATLIRPMRDIHDLANPNIIKVVVDLHQWAMYFSRAPIPFYRGPEQFNLNKAWHHIGIYGYRSETLQLLARLNQTPCESAEMLEQLRWLENGFRIKTAVSEHVSYSIDTPEDLIKVSAIIQNKILNHSSVSIQNP